MSKPRVAINGFGRIGRNAFRANLEHDLVDIVAVNDLSDRDTLEHLLKYDSIYGRFGVEVKQKNENEVVVNGKSIRFFSDRDPKNLGWKDLDIDIVIEATGVFRTREGAAQHIEAGAKRVIITAPAKNEIDNTFVMGVNEGNFNADKDFIVSNASCTTNCLAPMVKVLNDEFGIKRGLMTTIHSYTNDQRILDLPHKDMRRARAAAINFLPTSTGAAKAVGLVIPELAGKLDGMAVRVPTPTVSLTDLVSELEREVTAEEVNAAFQKAAEGELKGVLKLSDEPLVSSDYVQSTYSSVVDGLLTKVMNGNMVKTLSWYDNEWGYCMRTLGLAAYMHANS